MPYKYGGNRNVAFGFMFGCSAFALNNLCGAMNFGRLSAAPGSSDGVDVFAMNAILCACVRDCVGVSLSMCPCAEC